jgi:hypothetical protein
MLLLQAAQTNISAIVKLITGLLIVGIIIWRFRFLFTSIYPKEWVNKSRRQQKSQMRNLVENFDLLSFNYSCNYSPLICSIIPTGFNKTGIIIIVLSPVLCFLGILYLPGFRDFFSLLVFVFVLFILVFIGRLILILFLYFFVNDYKYLLKGSYYRHSDKNQAIDYLEQAIQVKPREYTYSLLADLIGDQAFHENKTSLYQKAIDLYDKSIESTQYNISTQLYAQIQLMVFAFYFEDAEEKNSLYEKYYPNLLKKNKERHYEMRAKIYLSWGEYLFTNNDINAASEKIGLSLKYADLSGAKCDYFRYLIHLQGGRIKLIEMDMELAKESFKLSLIEVLKFYVNKQKDSSYTITNNELKVTLRNLISAHKISQDFLGLKDFMTRLLVQYSEVQEPIKIVYGELVNLLYDKGEVDEVEELSKLYGKVNLRNKRGINVNVRATTSLPPLPNFGHSLAAGCRALTA